MGSGWMNLTSLLLGLVAWILPLAALLRPKTNNKTKKLKFALISAGCCATSLFCQVLYTNHLVKISDWSALMDTNDVVAFVCGALLVGTIVINTVAMALAPAHPAQ